MHKEQSGMFSDLSWTGVTVDVTAQISSRQPARILFFVFSLAAPIRKWQRRWRSHLNPPAPLLPCGWRHLGITSFPLRSAPSSHLLWRRKVSYTGSCAEVLLSPTCHLFTGNPSAGSVWFVCAASVGWKRKKKKNLQCYFYPNAARRVRWSRFLYDSH